MAEQYFLYTVTGLREPFYAAVDHETGRAWTSPTKDGAIRQARDQGIDSFVEKTITREKFLRSLGIEVDPRPHVSQPSAAQHSSAHHEPSSETPRSGLAGSWFVVGENAVDDDTNGKMLSIPPRLKSGKSSKPPKGGSPFAAGPIGAPSEMNSQEGDDFLIIPSDHSSPAAPTPFTDAPPPVVEEDPDGQR